MFSPLCTWPQPSPHSQIFRLWNSWGFGSSDTNGDGFSSSICLPHRHQRWTCCICVKLFLAFKYEKRHCQNHSFSTALRHKETVINVLLRQTPHSKKEDLSATFTKRPLHITHDGTGVRLPLAANMFDLLSLPPLIRQKVHLFLCSLAMVWVRGNRVEGNMTAAARSGGGSVRPYW